jgi:hypothetical protein
MGAVTTLTKELQLEQALSLITKVYSIVYFDYFLRPSFFGFEMACAVMHPLVSLP